MKVILSIFCGIMALFGGGCALLLVPGLMPSGNIFTGGWLISLPVGVFFLNAAVISALWGWRKPWRPAFFILAILDACVAALLLVLTMTFSSSDPSVLPWGMAAAGAFAIKGVLTFLYIRKIPAAAAGPV